MNLSEFADALESRGIRYQVQRDGTLATICKVHDGPLYFRDKPSCLRTTEPEKCVAALLGLTTPTPTEQKPTVGAPVSRRHVVLTPASAIKPKRVRWLWEDRLPQGMMALLAGRQGLGKSSVAYWLAAQITKGALPGEDYGKPRGVLIAATEDSWEHVIGPRLIAAGAVLDLIYRIEVESSEGHLVELSLPKDNEDVKAIAERVDASLLILDPLMSRLSGTLDSHKDAEVRQALEPLVKIGNQIGLTILGLIHHNKSATTDPVQAVMGSTAFTAVVRSVHTVVPDPRDENARLLGVVKSNVGRTDLATLGFMIEEVEFDSDDGPIKIGAVEWTGAVDMTISEAMAALTAQAKGQTSATKECEDWLWEYLRMHGGEVAASAARDAAKAAGHTPSALRGAAERLEAKGKLARTKIGMPAVVWWLLRRATERGEQIDSISSASVSDDETRDARDAMDSDPASQDVVIDLSAWKGRA